MTRFTNRQVRKIILKIIVLSLYLHGNNRTNSIINTLSSAKRVERSVSDLADASFACISGTKRNQPKEKSTLSEAKVWSHR